MKISMYEDEEEYEEEQHDTAADVEPPRWHVKEVLTTEERKKRRNARKSKGGRDNGGSQRARVNVEELADEKFSSLLSRNEDELLQFVAKVNRVYQDLLKQPAPFMTFVFCGMQSAGKGTIMERFLNSVLNIVQAGTGTRCPLDTTCIHDSTKTEPSCELYGKELQESFHGKDLPVDEVFKRINAHTMTLGNEDRFSTEPVCLVYRANNVQNMRFVDTPGIIANKSTGKDNREDIKTILRYEMKKSNTKLCVLLEPTEFATNPIVQFCDESFGGRDKWINDATFLMTKFDKQQEDIRTASKANNFFQEFFENKCYPHLVITPTLSKENLPAEVLFQHRMNLIQNADAYEKDRFENWLMGQEQFRMDHGDNDVLNPETMKRVGFKTAKKVMREIMLKDTVQRLPEVLASLRADLIRCQKEHKLLKDRQNLSDPKNLRNVVNRMLFRIQEKIQSYLDGNLEVGQKFPDKLQTLHDELDEEEDSEWRGRELNIHTAKEDAWRDRMAKLEDLPDQIQADQLFLGGKQYQRALEFFRVIMIDALPDPFELKDQVANVCGYLCGGLQHENWERAMVEITRVCLKDVSEPGLNFIVKHVGCIFRRLFMIALNDVRQGEEFSAEFQLIPTGLERFLVSEFDEMLWDLLVKASSELNSSMEPMYSTIDPNLLDYRKVSKQELENGEEEEEEKKSWFQSFKDVTQLVREKHNRHATEKKSFLPDQRTSMITEEETEKILERSFEYILAMSEFNLIVCKFQLNHHLYQGFKRSLRSTLMARINEANWEELTQTSADVEGRISEIESQIKGLRDSLLDVQRMQRSL